MTDKELLELAAKAANYQWREDIAQHRNERGLIGLWIRDVSTNWNPLEDDGAALRLAVKLNLHIGIEAESSGAITITWGFDAGGEPSGHIEITAPADGDDYAATRRAIVRAAAEIGKDQL